MRPGSPLFVAWITPVRSGLVHVEAAVNELSAAADNADALAPPVGHPRFPLVDSQRAIAALLVVGYHLAYVSNGLTYGWMSWFAVHLNVGVAIFFGISGFLLYRPFVAARHGAPPRSTASYFRNRVLRILPGYWVALVVAGAFPGLVGVFTGDWPWYFGFAQIYSVKRQLLGLPVAWTLAVEVSFYLLLPAYAAALGRLTLHHRSWVRIEMAGLAVICGLTTALQSTSPFVQLSTIVATFPWFAIGMALAVLSVRGPGPLWQAVADHPLACWVGSLAIYLAMCQWAGPLVRDLGAGEWGVQELVNLLYGLVAALCLLPSVLTPARDGLPQRVLRCRPLAWIGLVSFGIYLYHLPVLGAINRLDLRPPVPQVTLSYAIVALPATLALAAASYYVIERPVLRLKNRGSKRPRRDRAAALEPAAPMLAASSPGRADGQVD